MAEKPAVRVEVAWKRPSKKRKPPGMPSVAGDFTWVGVSRYYEPALWWGTPTSRIRKKKTSMPLRRMSTQTNHQLALLGNRSVKHRRGWSSRKRSSSQRPLPYGTHLWHTQIIKRSMQGKPVFPMTIRKAPISRGGTVFWKETIESGVRVKPRSQNREAVVKKVLEDISAM